MYFPKDLINKRTGDNWKYDSNKDTIIKSETVAGKMQPAANGINRKLKNGGDLDGNQFRARPLKHWRKQRTPVYVEQTFTNTLESTFEIPGATNVVLKSEGEKCAPCKNQTIVPADTIAYLPNGKNVKKATESFADMITYVNKCPATSINENVPKCVYVCDPEKKARKRVQYPSVLNTNSSKPKYYTSNASYIRARCRTFNQNQFQYGGQNVNKCDNLTNPSAFRTNCASCVNCHTNSPGCNQKISYYKPNNCKFAVQGGVSSSLRISKLKYDTVRFENN